MKLTVLVMAAAMALGACAGGAPAPEATAVADGKAIAEQQCARCHSLAPGADAASGPPPLPTVLASYSGDVLEEEFIEGLKVGHAAMPTFQFEPRGAEALIAYLRSIQVRSERE